MVRTGGPCFLLIDRSFCESFSDGESGPDGADEKGPSVGTGGGAEGLLRRKSCHVDSKTGGVPMRGLMLFESVNELDVDAAVPEPVVAGGMGWKCCGSAVANEGMRLMPAAGDDDSGTDSSAAEYDSDVSAAVLVFISGDDVLVASARRDTSGEPGKLLVRDDISR